MISLDIVASPPLALFGLEGIGSSFLSVLATVLGIGLLIFVHEAGHFLVAKWAGVTVEVFSLGFGKRLFGFTRGGTDYRISMLPLGGYVKMLGQDDADPTQARTEDPGDFRNKPVGKRMAILVAGVCMNALFALFAFIVAFAVGVDFVAPEIGAVDAGSAAEKAEVVGRPDAPRGLRRGDQVVAIEGKEILAFEDISTIVALSGEAVTIDVDRPTGHGAQLERITFRARPQQNEDEPFPKIGIRPADVIGGANSGTPAALAGLKDNDQIVGIAPIASPAIAETKPEEVLTYILAHPGEKAQLLVLRREFDQDGRPTKSEQVRVEITINSNPEYELGVEFYDEPHVRAVTADSPAKGKIEPGDTIVSIAGRAATATSLRQLVREVGDATAKDPKDARRTLPVEVVVRRRMPDRSEALKTLSIALDRRGQQEGWFLGVGYGADRVKSVEPGSPAASIGLELNDRVMSAKTEKMLGLVWRGGRSLDSGREALEELVRELKDKEFLLVWEKPGGDEKKSVVAARKSATRAYGSQPFELARGRPIMIRRGIGGACALGVSRTVRMTEQLVLTLRALVTGRVSKKELGGPLKIMEVTYHYAQVGFGKLLYVLALLSVNLAVLNILPIPVLDGGHLFLLTIEKLKGKPLSENVLAYTQWVGLFLILGLMVAVTFNDIRGWFE